MNPRANQWHWLCQPTWKKKSRKLLGDERSYVEEALGGAAHQRLHTCDGRFPQELTTLLIELS
jgi:hypothetical protein